MAGVVRVRVSPARTVPASSVATGATRTRTVAVLVFPAASVTVYVNESVPEVPSAGVIVIEPSAPRTTVVCAPPVTAVTVRPVPASLPVRVPAVTTSGVPAVVVRRSSCAFGRTVTVTSPVDVPPEPSVAV